MVSPAITTTLIITGLCTWYGPGFLGDYHAAHWHSDTPVFAPEIVTGDFPGVAASIVFQFGEVLEFTRLDTGQRAYGVVLDRRRRHSARHVRYFDAWPLLAKRLGFGPTHGPHDVGVINVRVERTGWILESKEK